MRRRRSMWSPQRAGRGGRDWIPRTGHPLVQSLSPPPPPQLPPPLPCPPPVAVEGPECPMASAQWPKCEVIVKNSITDKTAVLHFINLFTHHNADLSVMKTCANHVKKVVHVSCPSRDQFWCQFQGSQLLVCIPAICFSASCSLTLSFASLSVWSLETDALSL